MTKFRVSYEFGAKLAKPYRYTVTDKAFVFKEKNNDKCY